MNKTIKLLLLTNGLILLAAAMLGPIYALFVEEIGGNLLDASFAGAIFALAAGLTSLISGKMSDKTQRPELIVALGYLLMAMGFIGFIYTKSLNMLFAMQILIGVGEAIYSPAFDEIYSTHLDKNHEGAEWGAWESMNYFVTAVAAIVGGFIASTYGFSALFLAMSSMVILSVLIILLVPKKSFR
jgi:MFS family permease